LEAAVRNIETHQEDPDMTEFLEYFKDNWDQLALLATIVLVLLAYWKSRSVWKTRDFLGRINFSLNYIQENGLKIRTLQESNIDEILLNNSHGRRMVLRAAGRTTLKKPFLELPKRDAWIVLNSVLNEISEQFADGFLAVAAGLPTRTTTFLFGITCERDRDVRVNKIRVMIIERSLLEKIDELVEIEFESPNHHVRLETLKTMRAIHLDKNRQDQLGRVDLVMRETV
jgi:hypothetical protein